MRTNASSAYNGDMNHTIASNPITVRLDPDVAEQLDRYCATWRRSRSAAVNYLLAIEFDQQREAAIDDGSIMDPTPRLGRQPKTIPTED